MSILTRKSPRLVALVHGLIFLVIVRRPAVNQAIVPSLWPNDLGRVAAFKYDKQVSDSWRFVPPTASGLHSWADVVDNPTENARPGERHLVYTVGSADDTWSSATAEASSVDVVVILNGFLTDLNLSSLGNWTR